MTATLSPKWGDGEGVREEANSRHITRTNCGGKVFRREIGKWDNRTWTLPESQAGRPTSLRHESGHLCTGTGMCKLLARFIAQPEWVAGVLSVLRRLDLRLGLGDGMRFNFNRIHKRS
ncbi:hypothetical protein J6590_004378 [Homalodisca vitripennis]|nr:hypothetical protein J6590_004378 [Homalodisca vitripennis]